MADSVYIIHGSEIVQLGLASILQRHFNFSVKSFGTFDDFLASEEEIDDTSLIISGHEFSLQPDFRSFLAAQPEITSILLLCKVPAKGQTDGFHFIHMDHSQSEIRDRIALVVGGSNDEIHPMELTVREIEVLKLLAMGNSNKEIAAKLFISTHTVISHRKNISEKLSIKSASGLTVYAMLNNYIDTSNLEIGDLI